MNKMQMQHAATILHDLLTINQECLQCFDAAASSAGESQVKALLITARKQITQHTALLNHELQQIGAHPNDSATGPIYQFWKDLNSSITPQESRTIISSYEYQMDAATASYRLAMSDRGIPAYVHRIIEEQHRELRQAHREVCSLMDEGPAI